LKPSIISSPAAYFQVMKTAVLWPLALSTLPRACVVCQLEKEVRKKLGAQAAPVMAPAPPLGLIQSVPDSFSTLAMPITTPECTVPITTSTLSRWTSLLTFSGALAGLDSSSTVTYSISRPPSLPPRSSTASLKPLVMATPSWAKVPGVRQHQADLELGLLGERQPGRQQGAGRRCTGDRRAAEQEFAAVKRDFSFFCMFILLT
jgi:hypothetical protein